MTNEAYRNKVPFWAWVATNNLGTLWGAKADGKRKALNLVAVLRTMDPLLSEGYLSSLKNCETEDDFDRLVSEMLGFFENNIEPYGYKLHHTPDGACWIKKSDSPNTGEQE